MNRVDRFLRDATLTLTRFASGAVRLVWRLFQIVWACLLWVIAFVSRIVAAVLEPLLGPLRRQLAPIFGPIFRWLGRHQLALLAIAFVAPMLIAVALGALGWLPGTRSYGRPVDPQLTLTGTDAPVTLANGTAYAWKAATPLWTLVALPGPGCVDRCVGQLDLLHRAQIGLNGNQSKLRLLYLGVPPAAADAAPVIRAWQVGSDDRAALARFRPAAPDSLAVLLVQPGGVVLTWYPAGFDPRGLNKDLQKAFR